MMIEIPIWYFLILHVALGVAIPALWHLWQGH